MSKLEVDAIEPQSGTSLTLGASGDTITIPSGATLTNSGTATGFGKVLQVVQAETSTLKSTSSTTYSDSNLTGSITPSSASNKILILTSQVLGILQTGGTYATLKWKLMRDATDIYASTTSGGGNGNFWGYDPTGGGIGIFHNISLCYLDSPSTTSSVTYKTQIAQDTNGGTLAYAQNEGNKSMIILIEIAG